MGKSVGGKGIFFYIKVSNLESLTQQNFIQVQNYFINEVFSDLKIDSAAKGITRNQVIPFDEDVYYNPGITVTIPNIELDKDQYFLKTSDCASSSHKEKRKEYVGTTFCTLLDISDVMSRIVWKTPKPELGDAPYKIADHLHANIFLPQVIGNEYKHKYYRVIVNAVILNNPTFTLQDVLSFIQWINTKRTGNRPMKYKEMIYTVTKEYNRIKETAEIRFLKTKHIITNDKLPPKEKQRQGAIGFGEYRKAKSKECIKIVLDYFKDEGIKPTIAKAAELLKGRLHLRTITRYWKEVLAEDRQ
ncbi:MAG: hypothetical protein WKF85_14060 [Chitinophagaceae bacterium]